MVDLTLLKQYLQLTESLAATAGKEELLECARLLALNLTHYQMVYGELPIEATLDAAYSEELNDAQLALVTKGMETLVGVLGGVIQGFEPKPAH